MPVMLLLFGALAFLGGMLVAAHGPIYARLSEGMGRNSHLAVFLAFATAALVKGVIAVVTGSFRGLNHSDTDWLAALGLAWRIVWRGPRCDLDAKHPCAWYHALSCYWRDRQSRWCGYLRSFWCHGAGGATILSYDSIGLGPCHYGCWNCCPRLKLICGVSL